MTSDLLAYLLWDRNFLSAAPSVNRYPAANPQLQPWGLEHYLKNSTHRGRLLHQQNLTHPSFYYADIDYVVIGILSRRCKLPSCGMWHRASQDGNLPSLGLWKKSNSPPFSAGAWNGSLGKLFTSTFFSHSRDLISCCGCSFVSSNCKATGFLFTRYCFLFALWIPLLPLSRSYLHGEDISCLSLAFLCRIARGLPAVRHREISRSLRPVTVRCHSQSWTHGALCLFGILSASVNHAPAKGWTLVMALG